MKLILKPIKPRNPFVVASLQRSAGAHRAERGARRQQAKQALRHDMRNDSMRGQGPEQPQLHPSP